ATFQNPSNEENIENPKPKPITHKKRHYHKEILKENGKLSKKEEEVIPPAQSPKAKPDEKAEEGDVIQTLSYRDGSEDELFSKIKRAIERKNKYPPMARKRGLEGEVIVEFVIYKDGRLADIRIVKPSHDPFNVAALNAIRKAQNDFPILNISTKIELPIVYELKMDNI
ncbi:energy transducer TonB, partial [uncultured Helicobacter sp.]